MHRCQSDIDSCKRPSVNLFTQGLAREDKSTFLKIVLVPCKGG